MTGREQWIQFYKHAYSNGKSVPNLKGLHMLGTDMTGLGEMLNNSFDCGKDWFGVEWVKDSSMHCNIPDPRADFILEDIEDWREKVVFPDLEHFDFAAAAEKSGVHEVDRTQQIVYFSLVTGPFERLHALMGFENALMALVTDFDECNAFFTAFMDWRCRLLEKIKEYYNPDVIMYHDDIGTQKGMFFSPDLWRRLLKPHLKRATDKLHELGIFMEYHSCGKIEDVVGDLVEIGVDSWQGQEINDIASLKKSTNGNLEYHPILNYQKVVMDYAAGLMSLDDVRAFVRESILKNMEGGHYAPLMQPFGDEVTGVMMQEFVKVYMELSGDPS